MTDHSEPKWMSKEHVLFIHEQAIKEQGGSQGIRDEGLLESAIARPQNLYAYEEQNDIFELAASYAEGIARNHAFVDGNKRTAYATSDLFLYQNGYDLNAEQAREQTTLFENLAKGEVRREELAAFYRQNTQVIEPTQKEQKKENKATD